MKTTFVNTKGLLHKAFKNSMLLVLALGLSLSGCNPKKNFKAPPEALKSQVESELNQFAMALAEKPFSTDTLLILIQDYLTQHPHIYGAAFAFAPVVKDGDTLKSAPYIYRKGEEFITKNLVGSYNYTKDSWYTLPVEKKAPVWSEPYFDEGGGEIWMVTYSVPIFTKEGILVGVATSDLALEKEK